MTTMMMVPYLSFGIFLSPPVTLLINVINHDHRHHNDHDHHNDDDDDDDDDDEDDDEDEDKDDDDICRLWHSPLYGDLAKLIIIIKTKKCKCGKK